MTKKYRIRKAPVSISSIRDDLGALFATTIRVIRALDGAPERVIFEYSSMADRWRLAIGDYEFAFHSFNDAVEEVIHSLNLGGQSYAAFIGALVKRNPDFVVAFRIA